MCVCAWCNFVCVGACVCRCMWKLKVDPECILQSVSEARALLDPELIYLAGIGNQLAQGSPFSASSDHMLCHTFLPHYIGAGVLNPGPHSCTVSALLTEPSLLPCSKPYLENQHLFLPLTNSFQFNIRTIHIGNLEILWTRNSIQMTCAEVYVLSSCILFALWGICFCFLASRNSPSSFLGI